MRRVLFEWRGLRVWSYPAMLYIGLLIGIGLQNVAARAYGLPPVRVYAATLILLPFALAGSRLLFVVSHWPDFRADRTRAWRRGEGGLSMYGAVPCMLAASIPVLALLRVPFWGFWDATVFCIFPGMAFTRIGCLLNGCCSGRETSSRFSLWLPDYRGVFAWRIPVPLLESGAALLILLACARLRSSVGRAGTLFLLSTVLYASTRMMLERLRHDRERMWRFELHAAISVLLLVGALAGFAWLR